MLNKYSKIYINIENFGLNSIYKKNNKNNFY